MSGGAGLNSGVAVPATNTGVNGVSGNADGTISNEALPGAISQMKSRYDADRGMVQNTDQSIRNMVGNNFMYQQQQPYQYQPQPMVARNPATGFGNAPIDPRFMQSVASLGASNPNNMVRVIPSLQQAQQQYNSFGPSTAQFAQGLGALQQQQRLNAQAASSQPSSTTKATLANMPAYMRDTLFRAMNRG